MSLKKHLYPIALCLGLLFSITTISVDNVQAAGSDSHAGGSNSHKVQPQESVQQDHVQAEDHGSIDGHDEMEKNMGNDSSSGGHGESGSGGHGAIASEEVNWLVVGGFLGINSLIIVIAGILKSTKKNSTMSIAGE